MNRKKIILLLFFFILIVGTYSIYILRSDGNLCLNNPLVYGVREISKVNEAEMTCSCTLDKPGSPVIIVNDTGLFVDYISRGESKFGSINFSGVKIGE